MGGADKGPTAYLQPDFEPLGMQAADQLLELPHGGDSIRAHSQRGLGSEEAEGRPLEWPFTHAREERRRQHDRRGPDRPDVRHAVQHTQKLACRPR